MQAMGEGHSRYRKQHRRNYPEGNGTQHFGGNAGGLAELGGIERYSGLEERQDKGTRTSSQRHCRL